MKQDAAIAEERLEELIDTVEIVVCDMTIEMARLEDEKCYNAQQRCKELRNRLSNAVKDAK